MNRRDCVFLAILFYIGWFGSVLSTYLNTPMVSILFPILLVAFLIAKKALNWKEVKLAIVLSFAGSFFDGFMIYLGETRVTEESFLWTPIWLISIWLLFSFSIVKLAIKFHFPLWLSISLGAIMGPISYKSGEFFQVLHFSSSSTFLIYAIFWGATFPMVLDWAKKMRG